MRTAVFYNFIIEANVMAVIAILLMAAVRRLLRRPLGNGALCFGWLLVALRLLLPVSFANPIIHTIRSPFAPDAAIRPIAGQIKVRLADLVDAAGQSLRRAGNGAAGRAAGNIRVDMENGMASIQLFHLYLAGLVLVLLWLAYRNARFYRALRAGRVGTLADEQLKRYHALCAAQGVRPVPVYLVDPLPAAGLAGVLRPHIVLPLNTPPEEIDITLTHELCHLKRRDSLWNLVRLACCAVHWFNPLVWWAASMSRADLEMRCDDAVTRTMDGAQKEAYAQALVRSAAGRPLAGVALTQACMTVTGKKLKQRIAAVLRGGAPVRALSLAFMLLASMCLAGAFATSETPEHLPGAPRETYITDRLKGDVRLKDEAAAAAYAARRIQAVDASIARLETVSADRDGAWFSVRYTDQDGREISAYLNEKGILRAYDSPTSFLYTQSPKPPARDYLNSPAARDALLKAAYAHAETLAPGCTEYMLDARVESVWADDTGDYVSLSVSTGNGDYPPFLILHAAPDGATRLLTCTFAGNG